MHPQLLAEATHPGRLAAMARHPTARARAAGPTTPAATWPGPPPSFAEVVRLLTGPWRVSDPEAFAAAMTGAPLVAGHPVIDLAGTVSWPLDPWSRRALAGLQEAVVGAGARLGLEVAWVAGSHAHHLYVEARAEAPAGPGGPELFVLAHLVERVGADGRHRPAIAEHSWVLLVVGDGAGGVAGVLRAALSCPPGARCCPPPAPWARLALAALRERLLAPALGVEEPGDDQAHLDRGAVVLPFVRRAPTPG